MARNGLGIQYIEDKRGRGQTAFAGLGLWLELMKALSLGALFNRHVGLRSSGQGWTDAEHGLSLLSLNLVGGDSVEDIEIMEADSGLRRLFERAIRSGLAGQSWRSLRGRWRRVRDRTFPGRTSLFRYLRSFHREDQELVRQQKLEEGIKAFIQFFHYIT